MTLYFDPCGALLPAKYFKGGESSRCHNFSLETSLNLHLSLRLLLEKAMATHSNTLAWKIPWTEEPGGLPSMGSHRVGHD